MNLVWSEHLTDRKPISITTLIAALLVLTLVSGCSPFGRDPLSESMAITVRKPTFLLEENASLYWHSDLTYLYSDAKKQPSDDVRPFLKQEIENYLVARDYRFTETSESAQYGVVAVVVLGEGLTSIDVLKQFELSPSFNTSRGYEKGTIVVAILSGSTEEILWRGAIQGNIDLKMPEAARQERVRESIRRLFAKLPMQQ